jgi:hypothetical protein
MLLIATPSDTQHANPSGRLDGKYNGDGEGEARSRVISPILNGNTQPEPPQPITTRSAAVKLVVA